MFDPQALAKLAHDMKDRAFARAFAEKYRGLLDHRIARITGALHAPDFVDAMDATLSLKVSSTTVGTCELAELAQQIELDVRRQDAPSARMRASMLPDAAQRAHAALEEYLAA
ncbi:MULTISPECIES: hypothetical protein [Nocardioides]|uniref:HPt domain-containing protein n=1 Tax=Nocardioides lianchengensis TaxID=1045774 RepID=A0A1G6W7U4_9ACTN|nr:hypothetical protein [Nocardioides lianchengensis]NYG09428.1 HPt (histidine-containing phosphotransfer) domain-containing protein [Nocardioides lianchengensis]SDD61125.1 hypothetical protein SAMN05421872_109180 [Nocardioides lianchengensis]